MSNSIFRGVLNVLASLRVTVIGLFILMVLTIWGTLYQVDNGLYLAQERFYQSMYFMAAGFIPFPGAKLVMAVLFVNLLASMVLLAVRCRFHWGLIVTHLGLLLMLAAGAATFYFGKNAQLSLEEGDSSNVAMSFGEWELAYFAPTKGGHNQVSALDARELRPGRTISLPDHKQAIRVEQYFRNCVVHRAGGRNAPDDGSGGSHFEKRPLNNEPGEDTPGLLFTLLEDGREVGEFALWGRDPAPTALPSGIGSWIGLRRLRVPLPATIQLVDFRREVYPGSGIAKSFSSKVVVSTGQDANRNVTISMNKPLRLRDYTFYQSSFASSPGGREISTFSVVKNYGRLMPYVATGATVIGMLMHFVGMLITRLQKKPSMAVVS